MPRLMKTYKNIEFRIKPMRGGMWDIRSAQTKESGKFITSFEDEKVCDTVILEMLKRGATIESV